MGMQIKTKWQIRKHLLIERLYQLQQKNQEIRMPSSVFRHKQQDISADIDELMQQNRMLFDQNAILKRSLEELMNVNTELTESIEQFNNKHGQNMSHINQQELEQLAHKIIELEQQLAFQKGERAKERLQAHSNDQSNNVEQVLKVIQELVNSMKIIQEEYQQELQRIQNELQNQKNQWVEMSELIQKKMGKFEEQYNKLSDQISKSQIIIKNLQSELNEKTKEAIMTKKEMKISTNIQKLRITFQSQIQEKEKIISIYSTILESIKMRLNEKIG